MRFLRTATVVGTALAIGGFASPALADATLTPSVVSDSAATSTITINASNIPSNYGSVVNIQQCWRDDTAVGFDPALDCAVSVGSSETQVGGAFTKNFTVFNGDEISFGEWGCGPLATAAVVSQTCYVRLFGDLGQSNDQFYPFTYGPVQSTTTTTQPGTTTTTLVPPSEIPEAPLNVLLPATAVALAGGAIVIARRRQAKAA
ncbi:MAG: hypothetical protein HZB15_02670 [Actinobacteria bacterium]|nr:hypothetical protein [Actinomycetota bacterium]